MKAILKGLKHETSSGCNAYEVCDGKMIKSSPTPIFCAHLGYLQVVGIQYEQVEIGWVQITSKILN